MAKNKKQEADNKSSDISSEKELISEETSERKKFSENEVEIAVSLEKIKVLEEKVLRAHAEVENVRKTSQKEILKSRVFSAELITKDLLSPIDNLERSLQHSDQEIFPFGLLKSHFLYFQRCAVDLKLLLDLGQVQLR